LVTDIEQCLETEKSWVVSEIGEELPRPEMPLTVGIDGGYMDSCDLLDWFHVSMRLMVMNQIRRMVSGIQCAVRGSNASA